MREKMKVHVFGVSSIDNSGRLEDLLEEIDSHELADRVVAVFNKEIRIEDITRRNGLWYMDFGKFRPEHGPGKASHENPIEGFEFEEGEMFCEETACLYIPRTQHLLIQYNHHGARVGVIQDYFSNYSEVDTYAFELNPKYDEDIDRRFRNRAITRRLTFKIDPRFLSNSDRRAGTALTQAIEIGEQSDGEAVELTISAGMSRGRSLSGFADRTAEYLRTLAVRNPDSVKKLEIGIKGNIDSTMEVLDLLAHRLVTEFDDIPVGQDLRFPREERYRALTRAYNGWRSIL